MGPGLASHSLTPPKEGGPEGGKSWGNRGPQRVLCLGRGAELGVVPRHPDSAQAGPAGKGLCDVAWVLFSLSFCCLVFHMLVILLLIPKAEARGGWPERGVI
jgi:hypothetical protein